MKIILPILIFLLSIGSVFAAENKRDSLYSDYTNNVKNLCASPESEWSGWKTGSLIKIAQVSYADINNQKGGDIIYKKYLKELQADASKIDSFWLGNGPVFLDKASYMYKETMSALYACAVMNVRVRTINAILKIPTTRSNLKEVLTKERDSTAKSLSEKGCLQVTDTSELSLKKNLLNNTTYQYCNYRYYLNYLDNVSKDSIETYFGDSTTAKDNFAKQDTNTAAVTQQIARGVNKIKNEIIHTKEVFPQAMVAFSEFEKTYASHIILQFILQDYIDLRTTLKSVMNPIGQVIYKASNAQAP